MKIRKLIEEDGRKLAKIFDEQILATIDTNTLDEQIRKAVKDGLSNHAGEFANPWIFKKSYSHEELADILNDIMASERLFKNLVALFTEHSKQLLLSLPVSDYEDDDDTWFEYISLESRDKLIAQLKRSKGEDNE